MSLMPNDFCPESEPVVEEPRKRNAVLGFDIDQKRSSTLSLLPRAGGGVDPIQIWNRHHDRSISMTEQRSSYPLKCESPLICCQI